MELNFDVLRQEYIGVLRKAFLNNDTDLLEQKMRSFNRTDIDLKSPLDQTFRDHLLKLLEMETDIETIKTFVVFSIAAARRGVINPTMPVMLLGDIFESLTLDGCEKMFVFVEENVNVWKEELFFAGCKNHLLRLCNDLLRRLSRSVTTVFCGKILLFLAKFFPFSERSGLNIVSEFNLENVTEYDKSPEEGAERKEDSNVVIDYSFYCKFWQLQDFFRNPNQCYNKMQWKLFCLHSTSILNAFQGIKLEYIVGEETKSTFFAKFLTSQKLLDLQLYDVNFRRAVLLQFLIVFQYLQASVKFKSDSFELKADQKAWIQQHTEKVYSLLKETPPDGEKFAGIIENILQRELLWNNWKNEGCPDIKRASNLYEKPKEVNKPLLGNILKEAQSQGKVYLGSGELTKLWNQCPNNLEACKAKDRDFLPSLEDYFSEVLDQMDSNQFKGEENALLKDTNFGWRALRLLARRSPHFFTYSQVIVNPMSSYLEMMVRKIANECPGRIQEEVSQEEEETILTEEEPASEELKQNETEDFVDDNNTPKDSNNITAPQLHSFSEKVAGDWKKLAAKLGYTKDEIEFFERENVTTVEQAKHVLQLWFEDDEDATLENFLYILDGLGMTDAADCVRNELNSADNVIN